MRTIFYQASALLEYFKEKKIADLPELKKVLGTDTSMTVFRKLKQLQYLSSCSHSGKFYTLKRIARFNTHGLWVYHSVLFSRYKTLEKTIAMLIEDSEYGLIAEEVEKKLQLKPNEALVKLVKSQRVIRKKLDGKYVYFSKDSKQSKRQELLRKESREILRIGESRPDVLANELKAALIIFYSILNERQSRLFAGLESIRMGYGGDTIIADLFGINIKTVSRGRKELLQEKLIPDMIRHSGGGRKPVTKKNDC